MSSTTRRIVVSCLVALVFAAVAVAGEEGEEMAMSEEQAAMMEAYMKAGTPGEEHAMLAEHTGTWTATVKSWMEPGAPPMETRGTFEREMILDGRVLAETYSGEFMGQPFEGYGLTGYDNARGKFWGTWMDTMSTTVMTSWGEWDEEKQAYVYEAEYTDPMTGEPAMIENVVRYPEEGKEVMEMWEQREGDWVKTMEIVSVRQE